MSETRIEALARAVTADTLSPWGASAFEDHWACAYCLGRCDEILDEPGDWGHAEGCPWWALRRALHPEAVEAALERLAVEGEALGR